MAIKIPKCKKFITKEFKTKNERRCDLIHKDNRDGLSKEEQEELKVLKKEVSDYVKKTCPRRWVLP